MTTLVLQPGAAGMDAQVLNSSPDTNYGSDGFLRIGEEPGGEIFRAFHKWDLSEVPAGSRFREVRVQYAWADTGGGYGAPYDRIQRCAADWDESTITWNNMPSVVSGYMGSIPYGSGGLVEFDLDVVEFQLMFETNYGYRLIGREDAVSTRYTLRSSDTGTETDRPRLTVVYDPPGGGSFLVPRLLNPDPPHKTKLMTGWLVGESGVVKPISPYVKDREKVAEVPEDETLKGKPVQEGTFTPGEDYKKPPEPKPPPKRYPKK